MARSACLRVSAEEATRVRAAERAVSASPSTIAVASMGISLASDDFIVSTHRFREELDHLGVRVRARTLLQGTLLTLL